MTLYSPQQLQVAQEIFDFFSPADKLGPQGAVAAVVNAFCESSYRVNVVGDEGKSFGLWQDQSNAGAKTEGVADQCAAVFKEMTSTQKPSGDRVKAAKTSPDATYAWCFYYERPGAGAKEALRRADLAEEWMKLLNVAV